MDVLFLHLLCSLGDDANTEEAPEGWDIGYQDSKSHFTSLLNGSNEQLLNDFINDCENVELIVRKTEQKQIKIRRLRGEDSESSGCESPLEDDPERAFLTISQRLRQVLKKKQLPWVSILLTFASLVHCCPETARNKLVPTISFTFSGNVGRTGK